MLKLVFLAFFVGEGAAAPVGVHGYVRGECSIDIAHQGIRTSIRTNVQCNAFMLINETAENIHILGELVLLTFDDIFNFIVCPMPCIVTDSVFVLAIF